MIEISLLPISSQPTTVDSLMNKININYFYHFQPSVCGLMKIRSIIFAAISYAFCLSHKNVPILICSQITLTFSHQRYERRHIFIIFLLNFLISHADHPTNQRCIGNKNGLYVITDMKLAIGMMLKIYSQQPMIALKSMSVGDIAGKFDYYLLNRVVRIQSLIY